MNYTYEMSDKLVVLIIFLITSMFITFGLNKPFHKVIGVIITSIIFIGISIGVII